MMKLADIVEENQHVLATIEALDNGRPYSQALGDIEEVFSVLRYYGGWADKLVGTSITDDTILVVFPSSAIAAEK